MDDIQSRISCQNTEIRNLSLVSRWSRLSAFLYKESILCNQSSLLLKWTPRYLYASISSPWQCHFLAFILFFSQHSKPVCISVHSPLIYIQQWLYHWKTSGGDNCHYCVWMLLLIHPYNWYHVITTETGLQSSDSCTAFNFRFSNKRGHNIAMQTPYSNGCSILCWQWWGMAPSKEPKENTMQEMPHLFSTIAQGKQLSNTRTGHDWSSPPQWPSRV